MTGNINLVHWVMFAPQIGGGNRTDEEPFSQKAQSRLSASRTCKRRKEKTFTVHRLVAICFVDGYKEGLVVNHKNENRMDNRAENLEWCSQSYNTVYTACHLYRDGKRKAFKCRAPILQLDMNMNVIRKWNFPIEIKHTLGFNDWSIKQCCLGKRKQAYGYLWQFAT